MEGKDDEEEGAEVVKHFDEEVPREADVGFQVRDGEAVGELPRSCTIIWRTTSQSSCHRSLSKPISTRRLT